MTERSASSRPTTSGSVRQADESYARSVLPRRSPGAHKWAVGGVVVIAGSPAFTGAAYLTCRAAGRAGAGIVCLASGQSVIGRLAGAMPEVAYVVLPETDATGAARRAVDRLEPYLAKAKAVVIGPGLDDDDTTDHLLSGLFGFGERASRKASHFGFGAAIPEEDEHDDDPPLFLNDDLQIVVDADGLNWLARQERWWERVPAGRLVLTPHAGEMARLTGLDANEIASDPQSIAQECASRWNQIVVVKAGNAAVSDGTNVVLANDVPLSLATAGSGDVFAGMVAAFLAQGLDYLDAVALAFYAGTQAARTCEAIYGELGVIATDLPENVAAELRQLA